MREKKSLPFRIFLGIAILLTILSATFFIYVSSYYKAGSLALSSLKSDSIVEVLDNSNIIFKPASTSKNVGFIFYPGAKVEASAYAPIGRKIAASGYTVVIAKMNFNLAILSPNKADSIINENKDISNWVIGGHSLGGVMASDYALKEDRIKGLILLASYPQSKKDFTNKPIKALSLWGENDKVADLNKINNSKSVMPSGSEFQEIKGGNHGGFGDYGHQKGDGEALITNEKQMSITSEYIINFLEDL